MNEQRFLNWMLRNRWWLMPLAFASIIGVQVWVAFQ
jgi:hypothetical protein